jgi:hypothetical protein
MALQIYIDGETPANTVEFSADGYYFFLYPLFVELEETTGQMIDLYGDAKFEGPALESLAATLRRARVRVEEQASEWQVLVGWKDPSGREPIFDRVDRTAFLALIDRFAGLVSTANRTGRSIVCVGD